MSLINEMLRDLEARRATELGKTDLQREIRPLPARRQASRRGVAVGIATLAVASMAGGGVWAWYADLLSVRTISSGKFVGTPAVPASVNAAQSPGPLQSPVEVSSAAVADAIRLAEAGSKETGVQAAFPAATPEPGQVKAERPPARGKEEGGVLGLITSLRTVPAEPQAKVAQAAPVVAASFGNIEKTPVLGTPRERADAEYKRAQGMMAAGAATPGVADALQGALRQDPTYGPARQALLRLFLEARRIEDAMALLQEGLDHQPAQVGWALSLARLQVERGDVAGGEHILARSRAYGATSPEFLGFHGYLLHRLGQHKDAAEQYLQAARISSSDGRWWFGLGQALEAEGRHDDARAAFRRAVDSGNLSADLMALAEQKGR